MPRIKIIPDKQYNKNYKVPFSMKCCPIYWMMSIGFAIQDKIINKKDKK